MSSKTGIHRCPRCDQMVTTSWSRFNNHSLVMGTQNLCPMSKQRTPITGTSSTDYVSRAYLVTDLAEQVQDRDPAVVWDYLTALPANEVQRLLQIALAAVPVDKPIDDVFGWVCDLPTARGVTA